MKLFEMHEMSSVNLIFVSCFAHSSDFPPYNCDLKLTVDSTNQKYKFNISIWFKMITIVNLKKWQNLISINVGEHQPTIKFMT